MNDPDRPVPYTLAPSAEIRPRRDHCVIIQRRKLICSIIHPSEALVLSILDGKASENDLAKIFSKIYDIPREQSLRTIQDTIEKLKSYLCIAEGEGTAQRYRPEAFIYPGFSEQPGIADALETPLYLTLILGNQCNFRCKYCYADLSAPPSSLVSPEAVSLIADAAKMGVVSLCLSGGEPLLHPDIDEIVCAAAKNSMFVTLATNGSFIDSSMAERLWKAGLESIQVSLDAPRASVHDRMTGTVNTFDRVITGIEVLKKTGFRVRIRSVVTLDNARELPRLMDLLAGLNVDEAVMTTQVSCKGNCGGAIGRGPGNDELELLVDAASARSAEYPGCRFVFALSEQKWRTREDIVPCGGPMSTLVVHPSGEVTVCEMMGDDPGLSLGNFRTSPLSEIWLSDRHRRFLRETTDTARVDPVCGHCESLSFCRTGCYNFSRVVCGDPLGKDPRCPGPEGFTPAAGEAAEHA